MISKSTLKPRRKYLGKRHETVKIILCMVVISVISVSFLINDNGQLFSSRSSKDSPLIPPNSEEMLTDQNLEDLKSPKSSADLIIYQDPFSKHFDNLSQFFNEYLINNDHDNPYYYRYSDGQGNVTDDQTFSLDNLLYYKTKIAENLNFLQAYGIYISLKNTSLYYKGNLTDNRFNYGWRKSINASDLEVITDVSPLMANIEAIFFLINTMEENLDSFASGRSEVESMIDLINSSKFFDETNKGYTETNVSSNKLLKSNFYAILANLLFHKTAPTKFNATLREDALDGTQLTMEKIMENAWDDANSGGFFNNTDADWGTSKASDQYKLLDVNALGIMALLEYWLATGKDEDSPYLKNATQLFDKLSLSAQDEQGLWNSTYNAYEYGRDDQWGIISAIPELRRIDLEANALMMQACLKLFEYTGNMTYYNRSKDLYSFFETHLYNRTINAYMNSRGFVNDTHINFKSNLRLIEAYKLAQEIYNSTAMITRYNVSGAIPSYIIGEATLNVTSRFYFEKTNQYYETDEYVDFTTELNITDSDVNYKIRYPNNTLIKQDIKRIYAQTNNISYEYDITLDLILGSRYSLSVYANTTYFRTASNLLYFNVISGLTNSSISGLGDVDFLYQGASKEVTYIIESNRDTEITLNVSIEGNGISTIVKEVDIANSTSTSISFSLIVSETANVGAQTIYFKAKRKNQLYLEKTTAIIVNDYLDFKNLIYSDKNVEGENFTVSLNLMNNLGSGDPKPVTIKFHGDYITTVEEIVYINKSSSRLFSFNLTLNQNITKNNFYVYMNIIKSGKVIFNENFEIQVVDKFELLSATFTEVVAQGDSAQLIINVRNNLERKENFSLYVNDQLIQSNIQQLVPGENRIEWQLIPTLNPYDFNTKEYKIELKDSSGNTISRHFFQIEVQLSITYLVLCYILPIIIPIGIILYFKNKDIKNKLLRR